MDNLINNRKKQLLEMQQILKMQDLLHQYDRQNLFLNLQVQALLKQNLSLKKQKTLTASPTTNSLPNDGYFSRSSSKNCLKSYQQTKLFSYQKSRKSQYQYMYDEEEMRDFKSNIKNQIKKDLIKNQTSKEVQTNIQKFNIQVPSKIHQTKNLFSSQFNQKTINQVFRQPKVHINNPHQLQKSSVDKLTPVKKPLQKQISMGQSQNLSPANSNNKSKSRQKIQVSLKSRLYEEPKPVFSTDAKTPTPKIHDQKSQQRRQLTLKEIQQSGQVFLEHSFGNKSAQTVQKKFTILESDINLDESKKQKSIIQLNESRMSNKFLPLSIQSKQLSKDILNKQLSKQISIKQQSKQISTSISKLEGQKPRFLIYSDPVPRTESKQKRNHSLNPSPKVQFKPNQVANQIISQKINPFILKTQQAVLSFSGPSVELNRNPSQKIKRKFIKIVSRNKLSHVQSPKK